MNEPTPEQIAKLPVWARERITSLQRERNAAVNALSKFQDEQTESAISVRDLVCTGERSGPTEKVLFIQGDRVEFTVPIVGTTRESQVSVRITNGVLDVNSGGGALKINPRCSNAVWISVED